MGDTAAALASSSTEAEALFLGLLDTSDLIVVAVLAVLAVAFVLWRFVFASSSVSASSSASALAANKTKAGHVNGNGTANASSTNVNGRGSGSFVQQMDSQGKNAIFFFGSQTGTAEDYANRLAREARQFGFQPIVADMEQYDLTELKEMTNDKVAFFVVATYGEGEPTDNAQEAYKQFKEEEHEATELQNLNYVVFGLGNKTYEQFNAMGKFWDLKLAELGGTRLFEAGVGDDDGNLEEDYLGWKERMWPVVCKHFGIDMEAASSVTVRQFTLKTYEPGEILPEKVYKGEIGNLLKPNATQTRPPYDIKNPYYAELKINRELMKGDRHCMHIEVNMEGTPLSYQAGDHMGIFPTNDAEEVTRLAERLGITDLDAIFSMTAIDASAPKKNPFPCPTTYRIALSHYLDICAIPRTHIVKALIDYAEQESDKKRLEHLVSAEGKDELHQFLNHDGRHLLAVLEEFPSVHPPVDLIFELLPRLQCRYYSISSSPKVQNTRICITAVLAEYVTPAQRVGKGVATSWLYTMQDCHLKTYRVPVFIRKSNFKLPRMSTKSIIMVGPGTGLAPFRGFIQERAWLAQQGKQVGVNLLFFGCRHPDQDFLYEEELKKFQAENQLELFTAFSRYEGKKVYVQQRLLEQRQRIWDLLQDGACFYVCGDAKNMAREVSHLLHQIAVEVGGQTEEEATNYIKSLRTSNRYMEDVWS